MQTRLPYALGGNWTQATFYENRETFGGFCTINYSKYTCSKLTYDHLLSHYREMKKRKKLCATTNLPLTISPPLYTTMPLQDAVTYQAQLHPQQRRQLGQILHQHSPYNDEDQKNNTPNSSIVKTQNRQKRRSLQENPHCFVLFPIHHTNIWQMYKKANLCSGRQKRLTLTQH